MSMWEKIGDIKPVEQDPKEVIRKLFEGLREATGKILYAFIEDVAFFPEEVTYSTTINENTVAGVAITDIIKQSLTGVAIGKKEDPHPDFGYNPQDVLVNKWFRYRLLIKSSENRRISYELFKFKYQANLYPFHLYARHTDFEKLPPNKAHSPYKISNKEELESYVELIITSTNTIELLKRIMVIK